MSETGALTQEEQTFLRPFLPSHACASSASEGPIQDSRPPAKPDDRPFVTLTYACSLDSMIALAPGARTTLSGPETKAMTHYLRLHHDAILIGAGTAAVDDPGLNCRYPGATLQDQPQPVIVDPNGRWDAKDKKASRLAAEGSGKAPWVVARNGASSQEALRQSGGDYLLVAGDASTSSMAWLEILQSLKRKGIRSVMIEGGAKVITALLAQPELVDAVIITIAPTFLGQGGVSVSPMPGTANGQRTNAAWLRQASWRQFGADAVLCGTLQA
ncbi:hypothetical protein BT93_L0389 [Corymbia citriodora subsp. variegata]|uniref:Bacterial bifunctional deaminase-reductase C-terminal domain-containing protein n=1 Tax=Corymbia citriodora subsp. variegata TaxID=360336 RepID=A0A8T0CER4_CORYI|nr:hypothetical protein BT93_L0389 [Corymbia citriodora subsp. variegata]